VSVEDPYLNFKAALFTASPCSKADKRFFLFLGRSYAAGVVTLVGMLKKVTCIFCLVKLESSLSVFCLALSLIFHRVLLYCGRLC
jgi:hypothetical protein